MTRRLALAAVLTAALATACTVNKQTAPTDLIGPGEFGLSVTATADRDSLPRDGVSQASITVSTFDATGRPVAQRVRLALTSTSPARTGLSTTEVATSASGSTSFVVTAPPRTSAGDTITVSMVPIAGDSLNSIPRLVSISLTPSNPNPPVPSFTSSGSTVNTYIMFDATNTTDEGSSCRDACSYAWDFGDGTNGSGRIVPKLYTATGIYSVTLTAIDAMGASSSRTDYLTIAAIGLPSITVSPLAPVVNQVTTFTVTATPPPGGSITGYRWEWGDGSPATLATAGTANHTFTVAGVYTVRVTAIDNFGGSRAGTIDVIVVP
jgi:PKD repeat protein